jgi:CIC family chloride channel protein
MKKGDFTADARLIWVTVLAMPIGVLCAFVALVLQRLIGLFTNLFYYHTLLIPHELVSPPTNAVGWAAVAMIAVPVIGGLIIGLMARYGSDRIRGHGIPEAMEAILIGQSRMQPKVAVLKPLSSAVSIGSGGPFGAEGPIIMTGGAVGSIIAQLFHMTAAERKTLLVAGAAGGMAATFGTPIAATLLAVELLLFELKPRSLVPVAVASAVAAMLRLLFARSPMWTLGPDPLFALAQHPLPDVTTLVSSVAVGLIGGLVALLLTGAVYAAEDLFQHVPIHWMWWPALGGLAVGIGGYFEPRALGVGYENIANLLQGDYALWPILGLVIVKALIWATSLGSGTSGGVLAPLLMIGGAVGAIEHLLGLPGGDRTLWPLVSMAAVMGGTMRSPLTGVLFALELTQDIHALLPLLIACVFAHGLTVLIMKRSILTEKVARRGFHVSREYSVDPLELLSVNDIMATNLVTVPATLPITKLLEDYFVGNRERRHPSYPVVNENGDLMGVITQGDLVEEWVIAWLRRTEQMHVIEGMPVITYDLINREPITCYPWESARRAAERMAQHGVGRLVVVDPDSPNKPISIVTRSDILKPRARAVESENVRERVIGGKISFRRKRPRPVG